MRIPTGRPEASACVRGGEEAPRLRGTVNFYTVSGGTLVTAEIRGLPQNDTGFFAFHIHEGKRCCGADFAETGGHFNPGQQTHPRHAGDLPPLLSDGGCASAAFVTGRFTPREVVGRTVVIHNSADDFRTQPAGNSGKKIACGVIRRG
ncbi:MAG: superoxide dismutase family protein [Firmicutes bacterium]|nr:superoxide dismutase family protein [Bacillota bacterium]